MNIWMKILVSIWIIAIGLRMPALDAIYNATVKGVRENAPTMSYVFWLTTSMITCIIIWTRL